MNDDVIDESEIEDATKADLFEWCVAQEMTVAKSWPRPRLLEAALARRESLRREREVALTNALTWGTGNVQPDVVSDGNIVYGWDFVAYSDPRVYPAWSTSTSHGHGSRALVEAKRAKGDYVSGSQGRRRLFSTKQKALHALRYAIAREAAKQLLKIDELLAKEPQ